MPNRDLILLETVKTHRARLSSAFVFGALTERRLTNDNVRRLIGGIVLAAVVCAGCVGFSFVSSLLGKQAAAQRIQAAQGPATGPISASDTFDRQTSGGWGAAQRGGRWTMTAPAGAYQLAGGQGRIQLSSSSRGGYLPDVLTDRTDLALTMVRTSGARSGNVTVSVLGRRISSTQDYRLVTRLQPDGSVALSLIRVAEPSQSSSTGQEQLSPTVILFGGQGQNEGDPTPVSVRLQVIGTAPTTLRAKVWLASGSEPEAWTLTATDTTSDLQRPGSIGLSATSSSGSAGLAVNDLIGRVAP